MVWRLVFLESSELSIIERCRDANQSGDLNSGDSFGSCPIKNHCNTLSYNHKLTQSPNYNMGVAQTLVQIFTWITRHQNYLWHTCKIATESVLWLTKYGIFGKNGLTVIQNCHCNKKLKIYLNLPCIWKIWWPLQERFLCVPRPETSFK